MTGCSGGSFMNDAADDDAEDNDIDSTQLLTSGIPCISGHHRGAY